MNLDPRGIVALEGIHDESARRRFSCSSAWRSGSGHTSIGDPVRCNDHRVRPNRHHQTRLRLQVSPGPTGLGQICGGKLISVEEKDALDEHYVRHASLFFELKILFLTIWVMFRGDVRNEEVIAAALAEKRGRVEFKRNIAHGSQDAPARASISRRFIRTAMKDLAERPAPVGDRNKESALRKAPARI
jgi:hypothetical protein